MSVVVPAPCRPSPKTARLAIAGLSLLTLVACQTAPYASPACESSTPLPSMPSSTLGPVLVASSTWAAATGNSPSATATPPTTPPSEHTQAAPALTPIPPLDARHWRQWTIVPTVGDRGRQILASGRAEGVDPHAFSTIGDCQSMPAVFMGMYGRPGSYVLGEGYASLQLTIDHFAGSFSRVSVTVQNGMNVATVFSPLWTDPARCRSAETPLDCEFRLHHPSIVFINLGTNAIPGGASTHEQYLRQIVEFCLDHGALPILSTKADNLEGDFGLNEATARVAHDYDLPLWNFWRAVQPLPHHGLDTHRDGNYLSVEAWGVRSFTGLMTLQAVLQAMQDVGGASVSASGSG